MRIHVGRESARCHVAFKGAAKGAALAFIVGMVPGFALAEILWAGDFETGNFLQWHMISDTTRANFSQIPAYGRPPNDGDGSLLELVTSPVRHGRFAAKFTVKNSRNGAEPDDCDTNGSCTRRRTELTAQALLPRNYNAMPYLSERWMSASYYLPSDWNTSGGGWGPTLFQVKPLVENGSKGLSPCLAIGIEDGAWKIWHRWSPKENPTMDDVPWQQQMFYSGHYEGAPYPRANHWPDGLADFPDVTRSHAALKSLNRGGWTDWIIQIKYDASGSRSGGQGFMNVWKREGDGPWIQVVRILPKVIERGGMTFDHGICYNSPASGSNPGGFGIKAGMYLAKEQVWNLASNRTLVVDNIKVGGAKARLADMAPNGAPPATEEAPPKPPAVRVE